MSALVTQAITDSPRVLIISDQLGGLAAIKKFLQSQGLEIISTNTAGAPAVLSPSITWYKIFWLVPDLGTADQAAADKIIALSQVLKQWKSVTTPLISITTAVQAKDEVFAEWTTAVQLQYERILPMRENIDESRFIYYFNLADKTRPPFNFFVQKIAQQRLLHPTIELGLLSPDGFGAAVADNLLRPRSHPLMIVPTPKPARDIAEHIRELYFHYHQFDLEIFDYQAKVMTHPALEGIQAELEEIEVPERIFTVVRPLVRQLPLITVANDQPAESKLQKLTKPAWDSLHQLTRTGVVPRKNLESRVKKTKFIPQPADNLVEDIDSMLPLDRTKDRERLVTKLMKTQPESTQPESVERIGSVFGLERFARKRQHLQSLFNITRGAWEKNKHRRAVFVLGILVTLAGLTVLTMIIATTVVVNGMRQKLIAYADAADQSAEVQIKLQTELVDQYRSPLIGYYQDYIAPLAQPVFPQLQETLDLVNLLEKFTTEQQQFADTVVLGYRQLLNQEPGNSLVQFAEAATQAEQLYKTLSILQAQVEPLQESKLTFEDKQSLEFYQQKLETTRLSLSRFQQLQPLFAPLLGGQGKRVYAVLLQNEQELRPTGGFIQAVAFLTFDKGTLISVKVEDVYSLDQKLTGVVDPPNEIKQFLGEQRWYLRDSNWNGDFPEAAKQISWFLEQSAGQSVDGVIALNVKVLENLLGATGSIELPEYNELITAKNIAERVEFHSEIQLNTDETKPDYSKALLSRIMEKVQQLSGPTVLNLAAAFEEQLQEKNAYIAITRSDEHSTFELLGWSGSLVQPACPTTLATSDNCMVDSIAQVEANIGVNRANYYIQRQIDHTIRLTPVQAQHTRITKFTNTATSNAWPKGPYRAFTRFYLPVESKVTGVKIDDRPVELTSLFRTVQGKFAVYGVVTETPIGQDTELQLDYTILHAQKPPFAYAFFDQKQAGARDISSRVFLEFSPNLQPTLIAPQAEVQGNVIVFNPTRNTGHTFVGALFE